MKTGPKSITIKRTKTGWRRRSRAREKQAKMLCSGTFQKRTLFYLECRTTFASFQCNCETSTNGASGSSYGRRNRNDLTIVNRKMRGRTCIKGGGSLMKHISSAKSSSEILSSDVLSAMNEREDIDSKRVSGSVSVVMKFGGSSVADETRMKRIAEIIISTIRNGTRPCVVLSAMGNTTNLLLQMGELAAAQSSSLSRNINLNDNGSPTDDVDADNDQKELNEMLDVVRRRHLSAVEELNCDNNTKKSIEILLQELEQLLSGLQIVGELTPRASDLLSSFGERMSTRIFAAYLRRLGWNARQMDSFDTGFISTDDHTNGDILDETYDNVSIYLKGDGDFIPIVTGFLARGKHSGAITTLGRGGSDLSATVIGKALGLQEVQVWKDVDGVLTTDPRIVPEAQTVSRLTFEEATELAYFGATVLHPQSMLPAMQTEAGPHSLKVRVMNSYRQEFSGTVISHPEDSVTEGTVTAESVSSTHDEPRLTSIVLKRNVTMLEIVSTRMLGQYGFLKRVFQVFDDNKISVDLVTTSEVSVCVTLDPLKIWTRQLQQQELDKLVGGFQDFASVRLTDKLAIISLIGDMSSSSALLGRAFDSLNSNGINVKLISKGQKPNVAIVVDDDIAVKGLRCLHKTYFE